MTEGVGVSGSSHYLWSTDDRLGAGSMGYVYVGIHRRTEMKYAVKVFHQKLKDEQKYYIQNETDILARIPAHLNIITIIDSEVENYTGKKVIIMELCEKGSLREILNKTKNYFGLREDEFLLVFKHVGNALSHLHKNGIIHRNITPGNILCGVLPNGRHVYKIGNFAKSKLFNGEEEILRMTCESEEYMHPDLHRDLFLSEISVGTYDWGVDLWSFGVTVYKCATGRFPFMPYRGIKGNWHIMQRLTDQKEPGVISQVEMSDGSISCSKYLPQHSYLTSGTKDKVEQFLAMLFDLSTRIKPTYFFKKMHDFEEQKKIYIFDIQSCSMFTSYLHGTAKWHDVKKQITRWTAVPYDDQLLFWDMNSLDDDPDLITKPISAWLNTTQDKPLWMISFSDRSTMSNSRDGYHHPEDYLAQNCPEGAKETCRLMYLIEGKIKNNFLRQQKMMSALMVLRISSENRLKLLKMKSTDIEEEINNLEILLEMLNPRILHSTLPEFESSKMLLHWTGKSLLRKPDFNPNIVLCRESRCFQKSQKMIKDCEALYHKINKLEDEPSVLEFNRSEIRHIFRRLRNLYNHHCWKTTTDLIQICAETIRYYVSLIQAEEQINSVKIKVKELQLILLKTFNVNGRR